MEWGGVVEKMGLSELGNYLCSKFHDFLGLRDLEEINVHSLWIQSVVGVDYLGNGIMGENLAVKVHKGVGEMVFL